MRGTIPLPTGTVTFLFTDIVGSTSLWESRPEQMAVALEIHNTVLRQAIETHGGTVFKTVGDSFQAVFDAASQALKSAIAAQQALQSAPWNELGPLRVRIGLHTGETELDPTGDEYAVSHTKNRVARIMSDAFGGQILLSQETADLTGRILPQAVSLKDLGMHQLKGMALPEHLFQACAPGLTEAFPPLPTAITHPHNLPRHLTSLIGRQAEIETIKHLLHESSLVTLTGSGGVGKTRISLQAAFEALEEFPEGAWLVELAPVSDPDQVIKTVASTFNLREGEGRPIQDTLVDFLRQQNLLIVLDNCEHLLMACAKLADLLVSACPHLKLLASSREALGIPGEVVLRVPSLSYPDSGTMPDLEQLLAFQAVRLFIERANAVMPGFKASGENSAAIARICQRLDGIPLALELAAARINVLTTEQLASRLDNAFRLLTGGSRVALPRHQTLRATIDWSYDLLSDQERRLLRRLSVFAGGASLEAAETVSAGEGIDPDEILDLLASLANKSIIQVDRKQGNESRYRLLETVRQYAREKLFDARESANLRTRHLDYYLALAEQAEPMLRSGGRLEWSQRLRVEMDNLRSALEWSFQPDSAAQKGLQLVTAIGFRFLTPNGYLKDTLDWVIKGLAISEGQPVPSLLLARAYNLLAEVYENQRNYPAVLEWVEKSLPILRELGPSAYPDLTWALWNYGNAVQSLFSDVDRTIQAMDESIQVSRQIGPAGAWYLGMSLFCRSIYVFTADNRYDLLYQFAVESRQAFIQSGDRWSLMMPLHQLGIYAEDNNDPLGALQSYQEAAVLAEEIGDQPSLSYINLHLGRLQRKMGNFHGAIERHTDYVRLWARMGNQEALKEGFVNLGIDWFCLGESLPGTIQLYADLRAITLISCAEKQRTLPYSFRWDPDIFDQAIDSCRKNWGEAEYQRIWEQGQAMSLEEAVRFSLELPVQ